MIRQTLVTLTALAALTACSGGSDAKPAAAGVSAPKTGDCIATSAPKLDPAGPNFASRVKCTRPHLYEVTGIGPIPARFLVGPPAQLRDRLIDPRDRDSGSFARWAEATCRSHLWRALGLEADISGRLAEIGAVPATYGITYRHTLTPGPEWAKGHHDVVCFAEFADPEPGVGPSTASPVSSYNLRAVFTRYLGQHFPSERRGCAVETDDGKIRSESCSEVHDAETIFTFDARLAFGMRFVRDLLRTDVTRELSDRAMSVCDRVLPQLLESGVEPDLDSWFWYGNDPDNAWDYDVPEYADENAAYPIECQVRPSDARLLLAPGSVLGGGPRFEDRRNRTAV
ncbi:hypothetical protein [Aeromicrobium sp. 9AM]|uniref:hypothetical protein n=1 Tax=Aeromicrobium sp. 9AM TaxID=2653126 RepID=UPI0012F4519F|nr:hypothetical protein [Aeromicrobium sp. 9AM]VXB45021.1 exported hypothetical protein [Aeromicrobium sp. 9AM]